MQLMVRHPWLAACAKPQNLGVSTARGSDAQTLDPSSVSTCRSHPCITAVTLATRAAVAALFTAPHGAQRPTF